MYDDQSGDGSMSCWRPSQSFDCSILVTKPNLKVILSVLTLVPKIFLFHLLKTQVIISRLSNEIHTSPSKCLLSIYWFGCVLPITYPQSQQPSCNLNNLPLNPVNCCVDLVQAHWVPAIRLGCSNPVRLGVFCPGHTLSSRALSIPPSLTKKRW